jgi:hypothetical protein
MVQKAMQITVTHIAMKMSTPVRTAPTSTTTRSMLQWMGNVVSAKARTSAACAMRPSRRIWKSALRT